MSKNKGPSAYAIWKRQREPQLAEELSPTLGGWRPSAQQIGPMLFAEWEAMPDEQKRLYETESEAQSIQDFPAQAAFYAFKRDILAKYSYMRDELEGEGLDSNTANRLTSLAWDKMTAVEKQSWAEKARRSERVDITNGPSRAHNDRLQEQVDVSRYSSPSYVPQAASELQEPSHGLQSYFNASPPFGSAISMGSSSSPYSPECSTTSSTTSSATPVSTESFSASFASQYPYHTDSPEIYSQDPDPQRSQRPPLSKYSSLANWNRSQS